MKTIRLEEACDLCGINKEVIIHFVEEEWLRPLNMEALELDDEDIARIRLIRELTEEFGVNEEGLSIILQLLDQLNRIQLEAMRFDQSRSAQN
jgi:chaperone modulatory protein CbpM